MNTEGQAKTMHFRNDIEEWRTEEGLTEYHIDNMYNHALTVCYTEGTINIVHHRMSTNAEIDPQS